MPISSQAQALTTLKKTLRTLALTVDGIDEVDLRRLDHDTLPRRIATLGPGKSYWAVEVRGFSDRAAAFGTTDRVVFRTYNVRLEGWRGFAGTEDVTEAWEQTAEALQDTLATGQQVLAQNVAGFQDWNNLGAPDLDVVQLVSGTRAHHCRFEFGAVVFLRLKR